MAARPSWQGHLKLSLVTCPVALYNAISPRGEIRFNLINPETGNRIKMQTLDAGTEEPVERRDLVKGYEISKGEYITVTQDEIDSVRLESTKTIDIESFVPAEDIDRLYWDNPYYLVPDGKMAAEPYAVIRAAMEKSGQIALGRLVMSQRERLVALEPRDNGIIATMLRTKDEVRAASQFFDDIPNAKADPDMVAIAEKIINQKEQDFDPEEFEDRYEDALRELIAKKQKGQRIVKIEEPKDTNVIDLMSALRASLKDAGAGKSRTPAHVAAKANAKQPAKTKRAQAEQVKRPARKTAKK
jgi:DNA end-binding protein Ku